MAKIIEQTIAIRLSKLGRNSDSDAQNLISPDTIATLEQVVQELVGADSGVIVELDIEE